MATRITVTRVGVLSVAKIQAVICAVVGLIVGIIYGVAMLFVGSMMAAVARQTGSGGASALGGLGFGIVGGLVMLVVMVIMYTIIGFIAGAISALVYNAAAGLIGGLEFEYDVTGSDYVAPPPPNQQWAPGGYASGGYQPGGPSMPQR